jgi:type II secretory pathway component PulF
MQFVYEAMTGDGRTVHENLEAASHREAAETLRGKGLYVMRLEETQAASRRADAERFKLGGRAAKTSDLVIFTRQLKMLLESGSAVVPALEAIEKQSAKPAFRAIVREIREHVEQGGILSEAFGDRPDIFKPVFCSMVAAGEATGTLSEAFARLAELAQQQQQVHRQLVGALIYPVVLLVLTSGLAGVLFGFVIPRFRQLFQSLDMTLPFTTQIMFGISDKLRVYWPVGLGTLIGLGVAGYVVFRSRHVREQLDGLLLRAPLAGRLMARIIMGRVLRVWAAMLRSHVPLLETIEHSKAAVTNTVLLRLVEQVHESVSSGGRVGRVLGDSPLVEPVVASAISTGEENGRLGEAVEFVSRWMDDDNSQLISRAARLAEPALLALMGLIVAAAAMALFIPLFDIAAGG